MTLDAQPEPRESHNSYAHQDSFTGESKTTRIGTSVGGGDVEWYTPPEIFDALGIHFDIDAASPQSGPVPWVPADRFITPS
jgi:hypothetical protein